MPLPVPRLDDRTFEQLLADAKSRIAQKCPDWNDLSVHDPGIMLLELFAHLTEVMIYRFNRIPERVYVELLNLIGIRLQPPRAARVELAFTLSRPNQGAPTHIAKGTRVSTSRSSAPESALVFTTLESADIPPGASSVQVTALHCDLVAGELAGVGTGMPGLTVRTRHAPILAKTGTDADLVVAVEVESASLEDQARVLQLEGRSFQIWREVEQFADSGAQDTVYMVDRHAGLIRFAPAAQLVEEAGGLRESRCALAAVPPNGARIAVWYAIGGGDRGNVAAGTLDAIRSSLPGVSVSNPGPAVGGRNAETVENALVRGPTELYSLRRAVTARDYESIAQSSGSVSRARALTKAARWKYAAPGTVSVVLVPDVPADQRGESHRNLSLALLKSFETPELLDGVQRELDERRPLGIQCVASWAEYKQISVRAKLVCRQGEDPRALERRLLARIYLRLSPLRSPEYREGWAFGQSLGTDTIYAIVLSEPGIQRVESIRLVVSSVPVDVLRLLSDPVQESVWYAGCGGGLFRSLNDAAGWELTSLPASGEVNVVTAHRKRAGLLAVCVRPGGESPCEVWVSRDSAESWHLATRLKGINDLAWAEREGLPVLLIASDVGLHYLTIGLGPVGESSPLQIIVDLQKRQLGFRSVVALNTAANVSVVAAATNDRQGVYLSIEGGAEATFRPELLGEQINLITVQAYNSRVFLWAGAGSTGNDPGKGCFRREIAGTWNTIPKWEAFGRGWQGESISAMAFLGTRVFAASYSKGVSWLDAAAETPTWKAPELRSGLPQRAAEQPFLPIASLATSTTLILAGSEEGIVSSLDGRTYFNASPGEVGDGTRITIPDYWLVCSGNHEVEVRESHA